MCSALTSYLKDFCDGEELARRVAEDFKTPKPAFSAVLSHGDFHNGNLMFQDSLPGSDDKPDPIVLDWEFAQLNGGGINGDAADFTAGLHCKFIRARSMVTFLQSFFEGSLLDSARGIARLLVDDTALTQMM